MTTATPTASPATFASPQLRALCAQLAPVLARIPRAPALSYAALRDRIYRNPKHQERLHPHGYVAAHVRRWLDIPEAHRPGLTEYCARYGVNPASFDSSLAAERAVRADPAALAARDRIEQAAGYLLDQSPRAGAAERSAFAAAHRFSGTAFAAACARVRLRREIDASERSRAA